MRYWNKIRRIYIVLRTGPYVPYVVVIAGYVICAFLLWQSASDIDHGITKLGNLFEAYWGLLSIWAHCSIVIPVYFLTNAGNWFKS